MLFQVVAIQPSERWTCEMRSSSIWPLKGSAMPLTCRPMPKEPHQQVIAMTIEPLPLSPAGGGTEPGRRAPSPGDDG
jgi:hypothetical protein